MKIEQLLCTQQTFRDLAWFQSKNIITSYLKQPSNIL